eukprot:7939426-Lingulodinium_polyedra.AAC.1
MGFGSRVVARSIPASTRRQIWKVWKWSAQARIHRKLLSAQHTASARGARYGGVVTDVSCG